MKAFVEKVYSLTPKHGADEENVSVLMVKVYQKLSSVAMYDKTEIEFDFRLEPTEKRGIPEELRQPLKTLMSVLMDLLSEPIDLEPSQEEKNEFFNDNQKGERQCQESAK